MLRPDSPTTLQIPTEKHWSGSMCDRTLSTSCLVAKLASTDPAQRSEAAFELCRRGTGASALVGLLSDPAASSRHLGVICLARLGHRPAITEISYLLQHDPDDKVRSAAAFALGRLKAIEVVDALIEALQDQAPDVHAFACWALGEIGDVAAAAALVQALDAARDAYAQFDAAYALMRVGDSRGRIALEDLLLMPDLPEELRCCCIPDALL